MRVGLPDAASLHAAALEMERVLAPERLFVERTAIVADGVELIVGAFRMRASAPSCSSGSAARSSRSSATPRSRSPHSTPRRPQAAPSLRGAPLLHGVRGRVAVDLDAAAAAISALSHVAAAHPERAELEVNPLLVTPPYGAYALDARVALRAPRQRRTAGQRETCSLTPTPLEHPRALRDRAQRLTEARARIRGALRPRGAGSLSTESLRTRSASRALDDLELNAVNMPAEWGRQGLSRPGAGDLQEQFGRSPTPSGTPSGGPPTSLRHALPSNARVYLPEIEGRRG